jgi:hypothetical protein
MKNIPSFSFWVRQLRTHFCIIGAGAALVLSCAASDVVIPVPRAEDASEEKNLLGNPGFEEGRLAPLEGWGDYERGYAVAEGQGRRGAPSPGSL